MAPVTHETAAVVTVLVVDDDPLVRQALHRMLAESSHVAVIAEADDGDTVPQAIDTHQPNVVLMDLRMPRVDGITATHRLRSQPDPPEVLVLTTFETEQDIQAALRAGAAGYVLKHTPPAELEAAIRDVATGRPALSPTVARTMINTIARSPTEDETAHQPKRAAAAQRLTALTDQERAVALGVAHGHSNARIARELYLSLSTVKAYTSHAMAKLDLDNRTQLALLLHDAGLV